MLGSAPLLRPTMSDLWARVRQWPETSQLQARRNAMLASTACAQRRHERREVDDFLASRTSSTPAEMSTTHPVAEQPEGVAQHG